MNFLSFLVFVFFSFTVFGSSFYITNTFQNLYETQSMVKPVDILSCGSEVEVLEGSQSVAKIRKAEKTYFLPSKSISSGKPECLQHLYPEFFLKLDLSYRDLFFWAKLEESVGREAN